MTVEQLATPYGQTQGPHSINLTRVHLGSPMIGASRRDIPNDSSEVGDPYMRVAFKPCFRTEYCFSMAFNRMT